MSFEDGAAGRARISSGGEALEWEDGATWARGVKGVVGEWYDQDNQRCSFVPIAGRRRSSGGPDDGRRRSSTADKKRRYAMQV